MSVVPAGVDVSQMDPHQAELMAKDQCILVNRRDEPIGCSPKKECHLMTEIRAGRGLHRAFSVFLFNEEGKLLLQRRAGVKPTFPLRWTNTCCSHPLYGGAEANGVEGAKLAAIRKLEDELGIPASQFAPADFHYLTRIHYCALSDGMWGEHEIDYLMFVQLKPGQQLVLQANPSEVEELKWVSPDELRAEFKVAEANPAHLTPWFQMIADQLLFGWWENGKLAEVIKAGGLGQELADRVPLVLSLPGKADTVIPEATP